MLILSRWFLPLVICSPWLWSILPTQSNSTRHWRHKRDWGRGRYPWNVVKNYEILFFWTSFFWKLFHFRFTCANKFAWFFPKWWIFFKLAEFFHFKKSYVSNTQIKIQIFLAVSGKNFVFFFRIPFPVYGQFIGTFCYRIKIIHLLSVEARVIKTISKQRNEHSFNHFIFEGLYIHLPLLQHKKPSSDIYTSELIFLN